MDTKLISVIVPIYNVESYLIRCLDSIKNQKYRNFEVILINDGSTDNSLDIAREYVKKDDRFRLINQKNAGQGAARNAGIDVANGDYLAFVDSDDWVHEDYLMRMIFCSEANSADVVMCGVERVWETGEKRRTPISNKEEYVVTDIEQFLKTVSYVSWDKLYKRELFDEIRYPAHMKYEDYATIPRVLAKASIIIGIPDVLYYYFWREDSTTNEKKINFDILKAQRLLEESEMEGKYRSVLEFYFLRNVMGTLIKALLMDYGSKEKVQKIISDALKKYPSLPDLVMREGDFFHKSVINGHYRIAHIYIVLNETFRKIGSLLYHKLLRKRDRI